MTRFRRGKRYVHVTDRAPSGQKTVTAICGSRVTPEHAIYYHNRSVKPVSCPGCRAILIERLKEAFGGSL